MRKTTTMNRIWMLAPAATLFLVDTTPKILAFSTHPRLTTSPRRISAGPRTPRNQPKPLHVALFSDNETTEDVAARVSEAIELDAVTIVPATRGVTQATMPSTKNIVSSSPPTKNASQQEGLLWRGVVVALCAVWASNFAVGKLVMAEPGVDSSLYALARFGTAAVALAIPSLWQSFSQTAKNVDDKPLLDWETAKSAAICGSWVAFGYLGQTVGLLTTTASRSCVICTLHCVFVAVVAEALRVSRASTSTATTTTTQESSEFDVMRLLPAAVAVAGVALVELKGAGGAPTIGDALSFAQPIGFGLGYLQLEEIMRNRPEAALPVSAIKLAVVATASFCLFQVSPLILQQQGPETTLALAGLPDFGPILHSPVALGGILYTGLITTAAALWVESIAFKRVSATDASIILTTEPLFAAAAGATFLGETFGISDYIGASMIVGACALAVLMDDEATDSECTLDDSLLGKCEPPRAVPMSAK